MRQLIDGSQYRLYRGASLRGPFRDRPRPRSTRPSYRNKLCPRIYVYTARTFPEKTAWCMVAGAHGSTALTPFILFIPLRKRATALSSARRKLRIGIRNSNSYPLRRVVLQRRSVRSLLRSMRRYTYDIVKLPFFLNHLMSRCRFWELR